MKKIILPLIILAFIGCNNDSSKTNNDSDNKVVANFLKEVRSFEAIEESAPVSYFESLAEQQAVEIMNISDNNIIDVLTKAKKFNHCIIIVEDHTIVKISNLDDCKQSGSWGACMPMAEGYIKKGELEFQEDYINNIIGIPDNQNRTALFFQ